MFLVILVCMKLNWLVRKDSLDKDKVLSCKMHCLPVIIILSSVKNRFFLKFVFSNIPSFTEQN